MEFVPDSFFNLSNFSLISLIHSSSCKIADSILRYSFYSNINFGLWLFLNSRLRIPYKSPCTSLIIRCVASDVSYPRLTLPYKSPCTGRHVITKRLLLLRVWPSARVSIRSPFWEITLKMQSAGTGLCTMIACDSVYQNCNPWSGARDNFTQ